MFFLHQRCLLLYPGCIDIDTPSKSLESISFVIVMQNGMNFQ
jgi:hypothetical protein